LFDTADGFTLQVEVRDTGIGIALDAQEHIFDAFSQADGSTTRNYGGSGLGLAIVKHLLHEMGGRIELISAPGVGSKFRFQLPLGSSGGQSTGLELDPGQAPAEVAVEIAHPGVRNVVEAQLRHWGIALRDPGEPGAGTRIIDYESFDPAGHTGAADNTRCIVLTPIHRLAELGSARLGPGIALLHRPVRLSRLREALLGHAHAETVGSESARPGKHCANILLVEDNPANQLVMSEMLAGLGARIILAEDGRQALEQVLAAPPDLILMDLHMPGMDGYEAASRIRTWEATHRPGQRTPIIALTADALPEARQRCLEVGMDDFLLKPLLLADLVAQLERWLGQRCTPGAAARANAIAATDDFDCLDRQIIQEMKANLSAQAYARVVGKYIEVADGLIERIRQAPAGELAELLHQLKGSSANFGASKLPGLCKAMEEAVKAGDLDDFRDHLPELEAESARVRQALMAQAAPSP
jgi:CheY-like chemotaxis protein/HPt (histidine-containing phosphotransfer) domain-containing protein